MPVIQLLTLSWATGLSSRGAAQTVVATVALCNTSLRTCSRSGQGGSKMRFACFLDSLVLALLLVGSTAAGRKLNMHRDAQQAAEMTEYLRVLQS